MTACHDCRVRRHHLAALTTALLFALASAGQALAIDLQLPQPRPAEGRLVYTMEVTNPGTRSQGWVGTLYDPDGGAMSVKPGETVSVGFDTYVSIACEEPWVPCGMIRSDMVDWLDANPANVDMGGGAWRYALYVTAEGSRSEGWTGELYLDGNKLAFDDDTSVETPMGTFVGRMNGNTWGAHGWFPVSWVGD